MKADEREFRERLAQWSGFEHQIFVQSGSAALALAVELFELRAKRCLVPGLACWTVSGALQRSGVVLQWGDIDSDLRLAPSARGHDAQVFVAPWSNAAGWPSARKTPVSIADLTLCPLAGGAGRAAACFDAAVMSFGEGKPLSAGAGGVLMLHDESLARLALVRLAYGRQRDRWTVATDRYVFSKHLFEPLRASWLRLERGSSDDIGRRQEWALHCERLQLPIRPVLAPFESAGPGVLTPMLLDSKFPLTAAEVARVALGEGVPLLRQPVSPAYAEPAGGGMLGLCPLAEEIAQRLIFMPDHVLRIEVAEQLATFLATVHGKSDAFRLPYSIDAVSLPLPPKFSYWEVDGVLCRRLDQTFCVYDPILGRRYAVTDGIAATVC